MNHCRPTVQDVESLCRDRGVRFTAQRREVFTALDEVNKPISAYDLLALLEQRLQQRLAPLTIYRALDFLVTHGLAHKIKSNQTYMVCAHPQDQHDALHLICTQCGAGQELAIPDMRLLLEQALDNHTFEVQRHIVELEGICAECKVVG